MKPLNQYIQEKLIINKDYKEANIVVKSGDELRKIIEYRYDKLGPGTEQNPIDFNDIDVSNIDSFNDRYKGGIFENTYFKYIDVTYWNVSNAKSMRRMFYGCEKLESIGDISKWDVSNVNDMSYMFYECKYFNKDISGWDVKKVTNMTCMFYNCKSFNQDISGWNVSKVTNMGYMFYNCKSFNQDISKWDVSNVTIHYGIFDDCPIKSEYKPKFK